MGWVKKRKTLHQQSEHKAGQCLQAGSQAGGLVNSSREVVIERSYCALIVRQQAALYED